MWSIPAKSVQGMFRPRTHTSISLLSNLSCLDYTFRQWRSHWGVKEGRVPLLTAKNLSKIRKNWEKKRKNREEKAKIGKVLSLCPSWQIGQATLLCFAPYVTFSTPTLSVFVGNLYKYNGHLWLFWFFNGQDNTMSDSKINVFTIK